MRKPIVCGVALFAAIFAVVFAQTQVLEPKYWPKIVPILEDLLTVRSASAAEIDDDLCKYSLGSGDVSSPPRTFDDRLIINSSCKAYDPALLTDVPSRLRVWLDETAAARDGAALPFTLWDYQMEIVNDSPRDIEVALASNSPGVTVLRMVADSLTFKVSACSNLLLQFLAPYSPEMHIVDVTVGMSSEDGILLSGHQASLLVPYYFGTYYKTAATVSSIPAGERYSRGCLDALPNETRG